ncbi:hypothetical protein Sked_17840 [Sanguibacter keddieii DSM 10542]|uniref:Tfp pilus assembly protein PilO n=1 Tax=Sanguibacter keddieii (strain ATCC 51767 / DSM 10542 / NCFB 3025 / ST-74) TaxID=446469 RepID=D1BGZ1_SANKS|nr:type 4a pilus biogenesis protein PilO [Sanguibacter keddieii]ACZ21711.1 hypothetical protein Sked_17840 [Sanguibacter keddieii DSM 10542]
MPKTQGAWIGLAAIVCLVLAVLGWFLLISPRVDEEASIREQETTLIGENDALQQRVAALKADFDQIDSYRSELAATQVKLPTQPEIEDMFDEIDLIASNNGIVIDEMTADAATSLAEMPGFATTPAPAAAPAEGDSAEPTDAETTEAAAEPVETAAPPVWTPDGVDSLVLFPVHVSFTAGIDQTRGFLNGLQTGSSRYYLASNPVVTTVDPTQMVEGQGNLEVTVTVYAYVYTDVLAEAAVDPLEGVVPVDPSERDPFGVVVAP